MIKWYSETVKKIYWYNIKTPFYDYLAKKALTSIVSKLTKNQLKQLLNTSFKGFDGISIGVKK
jgi:hypothetical protein|tara:strand:+ start:237 stop:425 length:189 start_codon:yes stop_codon:yes gene_type:complete